MRGLKASIGFIIVTAAACFMMIRSAGGGVPVLTKSGKGTEDIEEIRPGIVLEEGTFPGDIYYEYADSKGIYHVRYDSRNRVGLYDIFSGRSKTIASPIKSGNSIHAFCISGEYIIWEEGGSQIDEPEEGEDIHDWQLYMSKDKRILKIDAGRPMELDTNIDSSLPSKGLSVYENYLAYKTYDTIPGTGDEGAVIKLYDMDKERSRVIFSLLEFKDTVVSDPHIHKNHVVWSTSLMDRKGTVLESTLYVYDMKSNSYSSLDYGDNLINPLIWENYLVCEHASGQGPSIMALDLEDGTSKEIASSDYSLFPRREIQDYYMGDGYVAWNSSYADSVQVYDLANDKIVELKHRKSDDRLNNSLLNIKLYGKTVFYTDHTFDKNSGDTVFETNRYIVLK